MAITLLQSPGEISFTKNPIVFEFQSDRTLVHPGSTYRGTMYFYDTAGPSFNGPAENTVLVMKMYNSTEVFTFKPGGTGENNLLPTKNPGEILVAYFNRLVDAFFKNFIIASKYSIDIVEYSVTVGELPVQSFYLVFEGIEKTALSNIDLTNSGPTNATLNNLDLATDPIYEKSLNIYAELLVITGAGEKRIISASLPTDRSGKTRWDVSAPLNDFVALHSMSLGDLSAICTDKDVVQYYLRYTEVYGENQTVGEYYKSVTYRALFGGLPAKRSIEDLKEGNIIGWLTNQRSGANHQVDQPQWLSWVNLFDEEKAVVVKVKVNYCNDTVWYHTVGGISLHPGEKVTIPVSVSALDLNSLFPESSISSYEVYLMSDDQRISPIMIYMISGTSHPYGRTFLYKNSLGAYETIFTSGQKVHSYDLEVEQARVQQSHFASARDVDFSVRYQDRLKIHSGYRRKHEIDLYKDFFISMEKHMLNDDDWLAINLDSSSIDSYKDGDILYAVSFDIRVQDINAVWGK